MDTAARGDAETSTGLHQSPDFNMVNLFTPCGHARKRMGILDLEDWHEGDTETEQIRAFRSLPALKSSKGVNIVHDCLDCACSISQARAETDDEIAYLETRNHDTEAQEVVALRTLFQPTTAPNFSFLISVSCSALQARTEADENMANLGARIIDSKF